MYFFPYSWHIRENEIHVYGFDSESNQPALVRLTEFTPYVYIKLPNRLEWTPTMIHRLVQSFKRTSKIYKFSLMHKRPLYYANIQYEKEIPKYDLHPYLFLAFESERERKQFVFNVKKQQTITGIGELNIEIYEHNATPILQLSCIRNISTADWFNIKNPQKVGDPVSRLANEYSAHWKTVSKVDPTTIQHLGIPNPLVMSYDIECNFHDPNKFSDGSHVNDVVFQISCVFGVQSKPRETWESYLLTLGNPDESLLQGVKVLRFKKEFQLLLGFGNLIIQKNPQILIGYNIFKFDIPFLYKRAIQQCIHDDFVRHGCTREKCKLETIKWSSSAYSNQEMNFIDLQGRMTIDLLTLIQRDFNLENYKLDTVAEKFLGRNKDPLNHFDIFMCYEMGMKESENGSSKALGLVGKYCIKDSALVLELFEKFQYWYSLTEMAKICQVPHSHLFLYGQQLKVFSQVYKYCYEHNIVVESGRFKTAEDDFCAGAYVFTPEPGLYDNVVSFDFQSLYPSIIISHNIDYTTLIQEKDLTKIPEHKYQMIKWGEHVNCKCAHTTITKDKDYRCKNYKFYWLRDPIGVLPTIIKNLLDARKNVRKQMKQLDSNSLLYDILNKRQLAYKVSSNSMYGALSTKKGYLPFLPAGMCVTAVGRQSIEKVSHIIQQEHKGKIVYGDSVTGDTPLLLRDPRTRTVMVRTIQSLIQEREWLDYPEFKLFDQTLRLEKQYALTPYEVWSDEGWTPIRKVIRHKTEKKLYRTRTNCGLVEVTEDHSLLTRDKQKIKPTEISKQAWLLHKFPVEFTTRQSAHIDTAYSLGKYTKGTVPDHVLNSSTEYISQFIQGYTSSRRAFRFDTQILAQQFYVLLRRIGFRIHIQYNNGYYILSTLNANANADEIDHLVRSVDYISDATTSHFVYDLETQCGRFQAGIGEMIVKNTDSNYVMFPHLTDLKEIWEHSVKVSEEVSKRFPEPMRLEFEEHIYARYLILSKKRYLYFTVSPDGHMSTKIENKGVLLKRRDNSKVIRDIYEDVIRMVLNRTLEIDLISKFLRYVDLLYVKQPQIEDFAMSKSVKGIENFIISIRDSKTLQYGDYVVPRLKDNPVDRAMQLEEKHARNEQEFYQAHLPGAVQLALRMRARGQHIESGSRLSYIVSRRADYRASVSDKMEEIDYFKMNYSKQMIDVSHYLHLLINPIEEVLTVMYGKNRYKNFMKDIYTYRNKYNQVVNQLYHLFHPIHLEGISRQIRITTMFKKNK